jgi:hypothetical protein
MALALMDMGLNGTLLFQDASFSENLPSAILKAERSSTHKRTAVITFNHALSQNLVQRPWIANLLGVQPSAVHWASVGNNLFHDRLASDVACANRSDCGCSDPTNGYIDCLAGVFDLVTLDEHEAAADLRSTVQVAQQADQADPHKLPAVAFANFVAEGVDITDHPPSPAEIRLLVDCAHTLAHLPDKAPEDLLDILFAGVYKIQSNDYENRTITTTLLNCEDDRATHVELKKISQSAFLDMISSSDAFASVTASHVDHVSGLADAQLMGVPILSIGGTVAPELFQEGLTGFTITAPADVQIVLDTIEQRLGNNLWRKRIHDWALPRFSARKAIKQILSQMFELPMHDEFAIAH